jgi:2-polyprenyl-3-methyl-5-hydroxy-6-metoxy-1,4-benzoquinol methylase
MLTSITKKIKRKIKQIFSLNHFEGSENYWKRRYTKGGNSGSGSYGYLAEFKAEILNNFVKQHQVQSVIEFGCGDGNQLTLANYPSYTGFDISEESIRLCKSKFANDPAKAFATLNNYNNQKAELALSLDVIFHLTEDNVYQGYMERLFNASSKYVIIYSSNGQPKLAKPAAHVRHHKFTDWIENNKKEWKLLKFIPNKYPFDGTEKTSFADFFVYQK